MADARPSTISRLRGVRRPPADLAAVIAVVLLTNVAVFAPGLRGTPLRVPAGVVFVLFAPGYCVVAALFPEQGAKRTESTVSEGDDCDEYTRLDPRVWNAPWPARIGGIERFAYAVGTSLVIVPLIAVALDLTPWGIRLAPFVAAVTAVTLVSAVAATVRRWRVPDSERFRIAYRSWLATGRAALDTRADATLTVLLLASIVLAGGSVGYAATVLPQDDDFSSIYLTAADGDFDAADYPTDLEPGESAEITVGVENHEGRSMNYTVLVAEQEIAPNETDTTVVEQREIDRFDVRAGPGETEEIEHEIEPTMTGENVRVVWFLYPGEVPENPALANANRHVSLVLNDGSNGSNATESVAD